MFRSTPTGFGSTRSRTVSNFTSACCTSRLARGNAQGQTHSETSSNYLCTNGGWETNQQTGSGFWTTVAYGSGTIRRVSVTVGATFAGYTILRMLGSGGMAEVYLAQHPRLPRRDALKVLSEAITADSDFRERFHREADLAATLWHPHTVGVHDRGEFEGHLWISMDYVEGTDAGQLVKDRHPAGMPIKDVFAIVTAVADALDYAHKRGLLHRDVKPANILLTEPEDGKRRILLADFGIARPLGDISGLTATNFTVGTLAYAAPEQLMGADIDGRADQYALAATAFHLLTGAPPYQHSNPVAVISQHLNAPPPHVADIRPELAALDSCLFRALSKDPAERFDNCSDFANALTAAGGHASKKMPTAEPVTRPAPTSRTPPPATSEPTRQRIVRPITVIPIVLVLLLTAAIVFVGFQLGGTAHAPSPQPTALPAHPPLPTAQSSPTPLPIITTAMTSAPPVNCGVNLDADQVRAAMEAFEKGDPGFAPNGVNQSGGNFDPCATLSTVLVYPYGASSSAPQMALMFHKGRYVSPATPAAYAYMRFNAEQTTDTTVVLDFAESAGSCSACADKGYESIRFRWQTDHIEMVGTPPSYGRAGP